MKEHKINMTVGCTVQYSWADCYGHALNDGNQWW